MYISRWTEWPWELCVVYFNSIPGIKERDRKKRTAGTMEWVKVSQDVMSRNQSGKVQPTEHTTPVNPRLKISTVLIVSAFIFIYY